MPAKTLPEPVQNFVDTIRGHFAEGKEGAELWQSVSEDLKTLLANPSLIQQSKSWPDTKQGDGPPSNLLFYEDPKYGFVFNALVKGPNSVTNVHDHGPSWTLYGVLDGGEHIQRFSRVDDNPAETGPAELKLNGEFDVTPGYIDVVPPWEIHQETNGDHRTIGFIVRSQKSGTFKQFRYNPETGEMASYNGPTQIPYSLL